MTAAALSMLLVAAALIVTPGPAGPRSRVRRHGVRRRGVPTRTGRIWARPMELGWLAGLGSPADGDGGRLALAGAWDLLAACLRAGMPVPVAVLAVAEGLDAPAGPALLRAAELLALGADPEQAWQPALDCSCTARLGRVARRSGRSGIALAESLVRLAVVERAGAREQAETRAQRAGVLIAGPLGLCFLPAFLAIGVIPVVIGLAAGLVQQW
ncbi:MAG: type II secretion system F family protein [Pseudonocardiales bacterium]